jgi:hypothetical protein
MSKIYANPFNWGEPVKGIHYVQRLEDQSAILDMMEKQTHLLLTGKRGSGKTSLLKFLLEKKGTPFTHLDLKFIVSKEQLFELLFKALTTSFPRINFDEKLLSLRADTQSVSLNNIFDLWEEMVKESNNTFIMVWDEFQHLAKFKENIFKELRLSLNGRPGITHIFVSHRADILRDVFGKGSGSFFKNQVYYELENLEKKACTRYLTERFRRMGLSDFDLPEAVYQFTGGQPLLTQRLAYTLAQLWLEGTTTRLLQRSIFKLLIERNVFFTALWDEFGLNEKRLLLGLAAGYSRPTELGFIDRFGLSATSTAHNTVIKLVREGWLVNRDEGYHIYDPLFLAWLNKREDLI